MCFLALCISASNSDSFPLQSGILRYVLMSENGVKSNLDERAIPIVCDSSKEILILLINVDLPPALGPVRIILLGVLLPILIELWILFLLINDGCHILLISMDGL